MNLKTLSVLGVLLLSTPLCFGIGRTGNGGTVADFADGFEASVPNIYQSGFDRSIPNDGLMITNPFGGGISPESIQFRKLSVEFPELAPLSRNEISDFFESKKWNRYRVENTCIDVYRTSNSSASNLIALWGNQKGVVILGTSPALSNQLVEIAKTIELKDGVCAWK